jgi:formate dehydrogenase
MSAPVQNVEAPDITRKGRRRPPRTPKGRQVDPQALEEVRALLTDRPRRRDLLIEHLHLIQDQYGHKSPAHLTAHAHEKGMALTEVYEVATFYAHFDVVKEGEQAPPAITVRVCESLSCAMAGAEKLIE